MGLGFGNATQAIEGFGILCMASIGPILTVMITGLWAQHKARQQTEATVSSVPSTTEEAAKALV
jgi:hypothetical protein